MGSPKKTIRRRIGWLFLYIIVGVSVFLLTSWLLPKIEDARRVPTPRIRISPLGPHESHPQNRPDLDRA